MGGRSYDSCWEGGGRLGIRGPQGDDGQKHIPRALQRIPEAEEGLLIPERFKSSWSRRRRSSFSLDRGLVIPKWGRRLAPGYDGLLNCTTRGMC